MSAILLIVLLVQLTRKHYISSIYWAVVVLLSVVGTLISDNLVDNLGVSLAASSIMFGAALIVVFVWVVSPGTYLIRTPYRYHAQGAFLLGCHTIHIFPRDLCR